MAHATTKARKTNQMTTRSQRSALDKPLRTDLSFPSPATAGFRPAAILVGRFRSPHHFRGKTESGLLNQSHTSSISC